MAPFMTIGICLAVIALLVGINMYLTGFIPFVGLIVPILAQFSYGSLVKHKIFPCVFLGGAFTVSADIISRTILKDTPIPIGAMTAVLGAPFFIYFLLHPRFQWNGTA